MKQVITLLTLAISAVTANATNQDIYLRSVEITDKIYERDVEFSRQEQTRLQNLFSEIEQIIDGESDTSCGNRHSVYQETFRWARSSEGLRSPKTEAMAIADEISNKGCPQPYFSSYRDSFTWARSSNGLSTFKSKAMEFASLVADTDEASEYSESLLACIQPQFEFARSSDGLNYSRSQAETFAKNQCGVGEN